jgi:hypothetical protein
VANVPSEPGPNAKAPQVAGGWRPDPVDPNQEWFFTPDGTATKYSRPRAPKNTWSYWDGKQWISDTPPPVPSPPTTKKHMSRAGVRTLWILAVLYVIAIVAVFVIRSILNVKPLEEVGGWMIGVPVMLGPLYWLYWSLGRPNAFNRPTGNRPAATFTRKPISRVGIQSAGGLACRRCGGTGFTAKRSVAGKVVLGVLAPKTRVKCVACGMSYHRG